uniref:Peptidase S1 domain-containing protein n=1 Tax=Romanomermis culicivorax TaxID=13658 RepID=A0A915JSH0_ROMCU
MGVGDYLYPSRGQVDRAAQHVFLHPDYDESPNRLLYDVALIKIDPPVQFSRTIAPIALPVSEYQAPNRYNCVTAGWHMTRKDGYAMSDTLVHHLRMIIEPNGMCQKKWDEQFDATSMICSNTMTEREASCYGDSGGPLACREGQVWTLFGVVSMGETRSRCINSTKPLLSSRVTSIISWVRQIQKEQE